MQGKNVALLCKQTRVSIQLPPDGASLRTPATENSFILLALIKQGRAWQSGIAATPPCHRLYPFQLDPFGSSSSAAQGRASQSRQGDTPDRCNPSGTLQSYPSTDQQPSFGPLQNMKAHLTHSLNLLSTQKSRANVGSDSRSCKRTNHQLISRPNHHVVGHGRANGQSSAIGWPIWFTVVTFSSYTCRKLPAYRLIVSSLL
ncbi:hypothetical protein BaRGS_00002711 [Batillaria attramentaria]|uniref:Uncharacterized protein n=1 Tax=Batillaria attramentaria TaxID=370345 RepID=A0ABD0M3Q5_9CAEN